MLVQNGQLVSGWQKSQREKGEGRVIYTFVPVITLTIYTKRYRGMRASINHTNNPGIKQQKKLQQNPPIIIRRGL
jgi:hypothetical protein